MVHGSVRRQIPDDPVPYSWSHPLRCERPVSRVPELPRSDILGSEVDNFVGKKRQRENNERRVITNSANQELTLPGMMRPTQCVCLKRYGTSDEDQIDWMRWGY
jgi:hypothetical protein